MRLFISTVLLSSMFVAIPISKTNAAITDKCDGSSTQSNVTVTATHGKVFYIDSGQNQNVDAAYVGYKIAVSSAKTNVWARVDTFSGGVVTLANPNDANLQIGDISSGYKSAFFLLKARTSTSSAQSHVLRVFTGLPNATGSQEIYSCTYTFVKVSETIKAAANKVTAITPTSSYILGGNLNVVVEGDCGTVGSGTATDGDIMWISPASRSSWPTSALRLTSVTLIADDNPNLGSPFSNLTDELKISALRTKINGNPYKCYYRATYIFKIVGTTAAALSLSPIAQISSGTQIKHTDMSNIPSSSITTNSISINATVAKAVSATTSQTSGKTNLSYTLTLANTDLTNSVTFDQIVDTPSSGLAYVAGSARLSGSATAEPVVDSTGRLVFSQPISVAANSSETLSYTMQETAACTTSATITYQNSAVGKIGGIQIGSNSTSYSLTTASGTCGTSTLTTNSTVATTFPIEVVTIPASSVTNSTAVLNGTVDPNGNSGQTVSFVYGTSSVLSGATTVNLASSTTSSSTPYGVTYSLSGLSSGTIYYFRIKVGSVQGDILNFVTSEPVGTPTATTVSVSSVSRYRSGSSDLYRATFNGTVDANQVSGGAGAKFEYALDANQTSHNCDAISGTASSAIVYELADDGTATSTPLNLIGAFPVDVSVGVEGLTESKYYCFRTVATWSTSSTYPANWVSFYTGTFNSQTITFNQISTQSTTATYTLTATASSDLTVSYTSNSPSVCTISGTTVTFLIGGTCSITATQGGNFQFYPADPVTVNFLVTAPSVTIAFDANGGSGTMIDQTSNTPTNLRANTFTRVGYTFTGWSTTSGIQSVAFLDQQEYDFSSAQTFYAQWTANTYSITYKAGTGGSGSDYVQTFTFGTNPTFVTNSTTGFTQTGKVVTGWNELIGGGGATARDFGVSYTTAANLTVYAQWGTVYTVTFSANGGSNTPSATSATQLTVGGNITTSSVGTMTKANSGFIGWSESETNGLGTFKAAGATFIPESSFTLYAQWITTGGASSVTTSTATILGTSDLNILASSTYFCYSATNPDGNFVPASCSPQNANGTYTGYSLALTGLSEATTYYYQIYGNISGTDFFGAKRSFTTNSSSALAPTPVTTAATSVTSTTATLNGTMNAGGASTTVTFEYCASSDTCTSSSLPGSPTSVSGGTATGTSVTNSNAAITGLTPGTTYYFRIKGVNSVNTVAGDILSFTTLVTRTVTYDLNTGSGSTPSSQTVDAGGSATLDSGTGISKTDSGFIGWATSSSGTAILSSPYTPSNSITIYAQWITTTAATAVTSSSATLNGTSTFTLVDPKFCYSATNPGAGGFNASSCSPIINASGTYSAAISGLIASTTYYFQINGTITSGGTFYYGAVLNFTTSAAASTYTITVNAGAGGTAGSSDATVTSGGNVTLTAAPSSGYSFSGWTCSGGGILNSSTANPATLSGIAANATCTANFTAIIRGGGGTSPRTTENVKIVVQRGSAGSNNPNRPATGGGTPIQNQQPVTTTITTTVVTQDGSKVTTTTTGVTNSSSSASGLTNTNGGVLNALTNLGDSPTQATNGAKVEAINTTTETKMVIDTSVPPSVVVNRGQNNQIQVQAVNGWTGRVSVAVVNEDDDSDIKSYVDVVINPLPVTNVSIELPQLGQKKILEFDPSPSQVTKYEVQINGKTVCEGSETSCTLPRLIGPKSKVDIIARGEDETFVVTRLPAFTPPKPIPALVVYFPLASSQLTRSEIKKLDKFVKEVKAAGFTRVVLEGHTDVQGARSGYDNLALSNSRATATARYLSRFLQVKYTRDQFAETRPAVEGTGEVVYKNNRRTEVSVW